MIVIPEPNRKGDFLGFNPNNDGSDDPPQHSPLTSDRRKEFVNPAASGRSGRVIRNIRRDAL